MDVAIVGIGIHPFGRTDGVTGLEQGVVAARKALDGQAAWLRANDRLAGGLPMLEKIGFNA